MKRGTFNILFLMRSNRTTKSGLAPILARITTSGQRAEITTQCRGDAQRWNQNKQRCMSSDALSVQVNAYLMELRGKILAIRQELLAQGREGNAFEIKERYLNPNCHSRNFLEELTAYCQKRQEEVGVRITQLTANKYHRILRYLTCYIEERLGKSDVQLVAINYEFIDGFNTFLQTRYNCRHNGAVNILCCLKNFTFYCLRNEWIEKNPFQRYRLKEEHNRVKEHLTKGELVLLDEMNKFLIKNKSILSKEEDYDDIAYNVCANLVSKLNELLLPLVS